MSAGWDSFPARRLITRQSVNHPWLVFSALRHAFTPSAGISSLEIQ